MREAQLDIAMMPLFWEKVVTGIPAATAQRGIGNKGSTRLSSRFIDDGIFSRKRVYIIALSMCCAFRTTERVPFILVTKNPTSATTEGGGEGVVVYGY
jgi:hypothetical protein